MSDSQILTTQETKNPVGETNLQTLTMLCMSWIVFPAKGGSWHQNVTKGRPLDGLPRASQHLRRLFNSLNHAYKLCTKVIQEAGCTEMFLVRMLRLAGNGGVLGKIRDSVDSCDAPWGAVLPHRAQSTRSCLPAGSSTAGMLPRMKQRSLMAPVHNVERRSNFCFLLRLMCVYCRFKMVRILIRVAGSCIIYSTSYFCNTPHNRIYLPNYEAWWRMKTVIWVNGISAPCPHFFFLSYSQSLKCREVNLLREQFYFICGEKTCVGTDENSAEEAEPTPGKTWRRPHAIGVSAAQLDALSLRTL